MNPKRVLLSQPHINQILGKYHHQHKGQSDRQPTNSQVEMTERFFIFFYFNNSSQNRLVCPQWLVIYSKSGKSHVVYLSHKTPSGIFPTKQLCIVAVGDLWLTQMKYLFFLILAQSSINLGLSIRSQPLLTDDIHQLLSSTVIMYCAPS